MATTGGSQKKAFLTLLEPSSKGGAKGGSSTLSTIQFAFNPKEFTLQRSAEWNNKPSKKSQNPEFTGTKPASVSIEVFLDASAGGHVRDEVDKLLALVEPLPKTKSAKPSPPFVLFGWGAHKYLTGIVKQVSAKFTRFDAEGNPIRAVVTLSIEELPHSTKKQNPSSGGYVRQSRTVKAGDTLASIATSELGVPTQWRTLAALNEIDDPFRLPRGRRLLIPSERDLIAREGRP